MDGRGKFRHFLVSNFAPTFSTGVRERDAEQAFLRVRANLKASEKGDATAECVKSVAFCSRFVALVNAVVLRDDWLLSLIWNAIACNENIQRSPAPALDRGACYWDLGLQSLTIGNRCSEKLS